jgi:hypothetical protein
MQEPIFPAPMTATLRFADMWNRKGEWSSCLLLVGCNRVSILSFVERKKKPRKTRGHDTAAQSLGMVTQKIDVGALHRPAPMIVKQTGLIPDKYTNIS